MLLLFRSLFSLELITNYTKLWFGLARSVRSTLTLTQINSEMNCKAKNKCPESQKLDTRRRGENLNAICDTCQEQQHLYFCILCLLFILCEARKASENLTFILKQSLVLSNVFLLEHDRSVIWSHEDLIRFKNNIPWLTRTIYNYSNVLFVIVIQVKHQKIWSINRFLSSGCVYIVTPPVGDSH